MLNIRRLVLFAFLIVTTISVFAFDRYPVLEEKAKAFITPTATVTKTPVVPTPTNTPVLPTPSQSATTMSKDVLVVPVKLQGADMTAFSLNGCGIIQSNVMKAIGFEPQKGGVRVSAYSLDDDCMKGGSARVSYKETVKSFVFYLHHDAILDTFSLVLVELKGEEEDLFVVNSQKDEKGEYVVFWLQDPKAERQLTLTVYENSSTAQQWVYPPS